MDSPLLKTIFGKALVRRDGPERAAYLDEACRGDAGLRAQVETLLSDHERIGQFLGTAAGPVPSAGHGPEGLPTGDPTRAGTPETCNPAGPGTGAEGLGATIGPYRLLQTLGEGGMGTVFMAEQARPVRRMVALKVIKAGMDSRQVIARFEAERQALALMDHVNIARVLDAGTTESGRPYFVMELIHGVPITRYCDDNQLTPRQRLELFVPVCQAIQHAHQKGVIHRDIKPSNVMVTLYDGEPVPKVIDFGVAKATEQTLTERTLFTQYGTLVGTLEYMSPEQAEMSALGVDTRSDIYALGVLLYELLTGGTPLGHERLKEAAYAEILRLIREEEPPRPSTRLSDSGVALASISANRHTEPARLSRLMRGELDWIVMKTLEKDRNRRYETASGFAADVRRYLDDEPVLACPPSAGYRLRKFARRNRRPVLGALSILVVLLVGIIGTTWGMLRATTAEANAVREAGEKTIALREKETNLATAKANEIRAKAAQKDAQENLKDATAAVEQMLTRVAEDKLVYVPQMEPIRRDLLLDALKFYKKFLEKQGDDPVLRREFALAQRRVGCIHSQLGQYQDSERAHRAAIAMYDKLGPSSSADSAPLRELSGCHVDLSTALNGLGKSEEAVQNVRRALELAVKLDKGVPGNRAFIRNTRIHLAGMLINHRPDEAEEIMKAALTLADDAFSLEGAHRVLGLIFETTRRSALAEEAYRNALKYAEQFAREDPSATSVQAVLSFDQQNLARLNSANRRPADAETLQRGAVLILEKLATDFPGGPAYRRSLAEAQGEHAVYLKQLGRTDEEEKAYRRAIGLYEKLATDFPATPAYWQRTFDLRLNLGQFLKEAGKLAEAARVFQDADATVSKLSTNDRGRFAHRRNLIGKYIELGRMLTAAGKNQEAESAYREALAARNRLEKEFASKAEFRRELEDSHYGTGRELKRAGYIDEAITSYRMGISHSETLAAEFPGESGLRNNLAFAHQALGLLLPKGQDEPELRRALALYENLVSETHAGQSEYLASMGHCLRKLAFCLRGAGKTKEAEKLFGQAVGVFERLSAAYPDVATHRHFLAATHLHIARLLAQCNRFPEAETAYRRSLEIQEQRLARFPDDPVGEAEVADGYFGFYAFLVARGREREAGLVREAAYAAFSKLIDRKPLDANAWFNRGAAHYRFRDYAEAVADLSRSIELKGDRADAWHHRGHSREGLERWNESIADHSRAIELAPENLDWRICRGRAYAGMNEWRKAAEDLEAGLPQSSAEVWYLEALLRVQLGQSDDYRKICTRMLERFGQAAGADAAYWIAWTCVLGPDAVAHWARPVALAEKAHADDNKNPDRINCLGAVLYRAGRFEEAAKRLAEAEAASRQTPSTGNSLVYNWLFQAMACHRLGRAPEAASWLKKAAEFIAEPKTTRDPATIPWNRRLTLQLLRREAEELLKKESGVTIKEPGKKPD